MPLALVSAVIPYAVLRFSYKQDSAPSDDAESRTSKVAGFDEWALVLLKKGAVFYRSAMILAATIAGFAFAQRLGVGLDFVAFSGAAAALLFAALDTEEAVRKVKWPIILFSSDYLS